MTTLKSKLILSYVAFAALAVSALGFLFNTAADKLFEQCVIAQRNKQVEHVIEQISQQFNPQNGTYEIMGLENIGHAAMQNGLILRLHTSAQEMNWDIRTHREEECKALLKKAEISMLSRYPNFNGSYAEDTYNLEYDGKTIATLTVGYYGPYSLEEHEIQFLSDLNITLIISSGIFFLFAALLGITMSKRLSAPIVSAIRSARRIACGDYQIAVEKVPTTAESAQLLPAIREMAEAIKRKEKQKKQITEDVAHELRTPLGNLQSHMEAMIDHVWEPTPDRLAGCHAEILRLSRIVEQLAELNLIEGDGAFLEMESFDFSKLCCEVRDGFENEINKNDIKFSLDFPEKTTIFGDYNGIKQCMLNLISNAVKYTPEGGKISISIEYIRDEVILHVSDNGIGIPAKDIPHIFERFYRVDKSRDKKTGGMGIGLAISQAIVHAHHGTIEVSSKLGQGTAFTITLPVVDT